MKESDISFNTEYINLEAKKLNINATQRNVKTYSLMCELVKFVYVT